MRVALNLAYLTEDQAKKFKISKASMDQLKKDGEANEAKKALN